MVDLRTEETAWLRKPIYAYGVTLLLVAVALLLRLGLHPVFQEQSRYFLLLPVVLFSAVYAGVRPGIVAATVGGLLTLWMLVPKGTVESKDYAGLGTFWMISASILWLTRRELRERERRNEVEARLASTNAYLESKIVQRNDQLGRANEELAAANAELESFCYSMAHDLRTPTRAIAGNARILLEDHGDKLPPDLTAHLRRINQAALKLGFLVDGLLTYARLAKQEINLEEQDLPKLAKDVIETEARRSKIEVDFEIDPNLRLCADERMLRVLLRALAENSILYRQPGEKPVIRVRCDGDHGFVFEDEGIGFEMAYAHKVFQPFERLHRDEAYPGVGMGLANVDRVVSRHEGEVRIDSEPNVGTKVFVQFPRKPVTP